MRLFYVFPLLVIAVNARPQQTVTSHDWKPKETDSQSQNLRTENLDTRTYKTNGANQALKESVKQVASQLTNNTNTDIMLDTRTPPKVKFQVKFNEKKKQEAVENSHPGIAVPIDIDSFYETTTQKRATIHRNENKTPTPVSGISTWILLSGQSTTVKPVRKQSTVKITSSSASSTESPDVANKTSTVSEKPVKGTVKVKPLTTKKPKTTTSLPSSSSAAKSTVTVTSTTSEPLNNNELNQLMTKIKASVLNNAFKNKTTLTTTSSSTTTTTTIKPKTTEKTTENSKINEVTNTEANDVGLEAKESEFELPEEKSAPTTKRPRRPMTNKRKKNNSKNRRRKPVMVTASDKMDTKEESNTKIATKEKPISTQIYNYLSREIMPTVGVGLVGLVVTAGLASYFLYPFGGLRRAYDNANDRKDYYYDEYSVGGMKEEELIGKVLAGMPERTEYPTSSYRTHLARNDYKNEVNYNYRNSDPYYAYNNNEFKTVSVGAKLGYGTDVQQQKQSDYIANDDNLEKNQFVVGNIPKEFESSADIVPEHGPRSLRIRRRAQNDHENEIIDFQYGVNEQIKPYYVQKVVASTSTETVENTESSEKTTTEETVLLQPEQPNFFTFLRNLIELKVRLGLELLLRTTDSFSNYLKGVQQRVNNVFNETDTNTTLS